MVIAGVQEIRAWRLVLAWELLAFKSLELGGVLVWESRNYHWRGSCLVGARMGWRVEREACRTFLSFGKRKRQRKEGSQIALLLARHWNKPQKIIITFGQFFGLYRNLITQNWKQRKKFLVFTEIVQITVGNNFAIFCVVSIMGRH